MSKGKINSQKRASLQQASVIFFLGIAAILLLALLSYDISDPGPFHRDANHVGDCKNWAGCQGAWFADLFFGLIGYFGYAVPVGLGLVGFSLFRLPRDKNQPAPQEDISNIITAVGALLTMLAGTGLSQFLFEPYPYGVGGGVLGMMISNFFQSTVLGLIGTALFFLSLFFVGITLVADIRWGVVADKVGEWVMEAFAKLQQWQQNQKQRSNTPALANSGINQNGRIDTSLFSSTQDWLKNASLRTNQAVDGLWKKFSFSAGKDKDQPREPKFRRKQAGYMTDVYQEDPLFVANNRRSEPTLSPPPASMVNQTTPIPPKPVLRNQSKPAPSAVPDDDMDELQAPDAEFLRATAPSAAATKPTAQLPSNARVAKPKEREAAGGFKSPMAKRSQLTLPPVALLNPPPPKRERATPSRESLRNMSDLLITSLGHYGVRDVQVVACDPGPVITRFELQLPDGTKASKVSGLANDLARNLCVSSVRVVEVIPGRPTIGIEVPNEKRDIVTISEMIESEVYSRSRSPLTLAMGKDISGQPVVADLARMPHLLVAGTTGSGKSVAVNAMLVSILYKATPEEVRLILIDPKMLELSSYEDIPHLITPVVTNMKEAANALRWCVAEMERRYLLMSKLKVRNIAGYNAKIIEAAERGEQIPDPLFDPMKSMDTHPKPLEPLPFIVVVVDEFADMMMVVGKKVEELIARLAQKARASGIHLILATQRPSVDVITGLIKANIPTRVAFQVSTKIDSRTILDQGGAEQLLGYGDMLYMPPGVSMPQRIHGALVTDQEVEDVATYLKQQMEPDYVEGVLEDSGNSDAVPGLEPADGGEESDALYDEAVAVVTESRRASISYLQRRLKVGYNRAARMIEDMEVAGVVSPVLGNGTRDVLAPAPVKD